VRAADPRAVAAGVREYTIDARFVAASNRDLAASVHAGTFRADLYFRLAGLVIRIPPLRARGDEIEPLAHRFMADACARTGRPCPVLAAEVVAWLHTHPWPGNVRELKTLMERAALFTDGVEVRLADLPRDAIGELEPTPASPPTAADDERARIVDALERCGGNQTRAAALLGMPRRTLVRRLDELGVPRPKKG
jgi:DNA-binding NtrC family response regulator